MANLRRDPRDSFYVTTADGSAYAVAEGRADLTPPAAGPADATVEELIDVYRGVRGEHPDWADYRAAMVAGRRLVIRIHVERLYGTGLHGPYAMAVTDGSPPATTSLDFLSSIIPGLPSAAQRGTVTGSASGSWGALPVTAALSGPSGQYWAPVQGGRFTVTGVRPGTYTTTLYAGELAVSSPGAVSVGAGQTVSTVLSGDAPANGTLVQIGTFDGTPQGLRNADRIETMHPSDVRMDGWNVGSFTAGSAASGFPMALFKAVNPTITVNFGLGSVPAGGVRLRIATTIAFAGGRPAVSIGGFTSPASASPVPVDLNSRGITRGTWRGVNRTYTFAIPAGALHTGTNSLAITVISGSSGTGFLSPNFVFDAVALDPA